MKLRILLVLVWLPVSALSLSEAWATVLLFDQARDAATDSLVLPILAGARVPQDYGDGVTSQAQDVPGGTYTYGESGEGFTPNVKVEYFVSNSRVSTYPGVSMWTSGYGGLSNVIFGTQGSAALNVRLSADQGFEVLLYGFHLAGWPTTNYSLNSVRVWHGASTIYGLPNPEIRGSGDDNNFTQFRFDAPLQATELLIEIDYENLANSLQDNIGMDNIRFGQYPSAITPDPTPLPAPSSLALLGTALACFGMARLSGRNWSSVRCQGYCLHVP